MKKQIPRRISHQNRKPSKNSRAFDYSLDYKKLDLRRSPEIYRVGRSEQGVLLVEPYKSEILPHWRFKTPDVAVKSANKIMDLFLQYKAAEDFIGMDMARKFLQMGYTRSRRYANHKSGQKYGADLNILPFENDAEKALSAEIFHEAWQSAEADPEYMMMKQLWREAFG